MNERIAINPEQFSSELFELFSQQWFLLTAGDFASGEINTMTVSWGLLGYLWHRPVAEVVVRPQRWTMKFIEKHDSFTLCAFPGAMRSALELCGSKSGRDIDKIASAGLTAIESEDIEAPGFAEAELIIECRKLYTGEFTPKGFNDKNIPEEIYASDDFHKFFIGEIKQISAIEKYVI